MTPEKLAARIDGLVEDAEKSFGKQVAKTQTAVFEQVQLLLKKLELNPDGTIKQSQANRAILAKSEQYVNTALKDSGYYQSLNNTPETIAAMTDGNAKYFDALLGASFTPDAQYIKNLQKQTIGQVETLLANDGLKVALKEPIKNILNQNVNTSAAYSDLVSQLRTFIMGSPELDGQLARYSKQIVTDTLFNYSRAFQEAISENAGLNWTKYVGGAMDTSRGFCLTKIGGYYEKDDVEKWAAQSWAGKRAGTTRSTIFIYAGGYNCRHQIIYVSDAAVPQTNTDAKKLMKDARAVGDELQEKAQKIATKNGAALTPINYKGYESLVRKAKDDLNGRVFPGYYANDKGIQDSVRNTIITDKANLKNVAGQVKDSKGTISFKNQDFANSGYRGFLANVKLSNGTIGEIQINTPEMIYAKEEPKIAKMVIGDAKWAEINKKTGLEGGLGHKYYEESRKLGTPGKNGEKNFTQAEKDQLAVISRKSVDYYEKFYYSYPSDWKVK